MAVSFDVTEEHCSICCEALNCWPRSGDQATAEMGISVLPCCHGFHSECFYGFNGNCPNCRRPWQAHEVTDHVLGDLECIEEDDGEFSEDEEVFQELDIVKDLNWTRYQDPELFYYWDTGEGGFAFRESDARWNVYLHCGRRWWCDADQISWFFEDSGCQL